MEPAGAIGVALGPVLPLLGDLAGVGLLTLLAGAVTTHARKRDAVTRKPVPLVGCRVQPTETADSR
ncbi:DoxX family protein [Streptomyces sp. NRRL S-1022]|uniref:DoxX family protein n=1 Tax=Streptomyces sp. NRRL S-1022 TaxID=1463880 RepID=UPI000D13F1CB